MKYLNCIFPLLFFRYICPSAITCRSKGSIAFLLIWEADQEFNGVVFVTKNDSTILKKAYGMSDFENNVPLTTSSVFDLASLTKQFTAMGIVLLQKENKLDYDNKVAEISTRTFYLSSRLLFSNYSTIHLVCLIIWNLWKMYGINRTMLPTMM